MLHLLMDQYKHVRLPHDKTLSDNKLKGGGNGSSNVVRE